MQRFHPPPLERGRLFAAATDRGVAQIERINIRIHFLGETFAVVVVLQKKDCVRNYIGGFSGKKTQGQNEILTAISSLSFPLFFGANPREIERGG